MSFPLLAFLNDNLNDAEKLLIANKLLNAGANVSITNKANQDAIQIGKKYFYSNKIGNFILFAVHFNIEIIIIVVFYEKSRTQIQNHKEFDFIFI